MHPQNQADAFGIEKTELRRDNALGGIYTIHSFKYYYFHYVIIYISHLS